MKEKILAFLKGRLQGTSESYLNGIAEYYAKTITDETQIEATLTDGVVDLLKLNAGLLQSEGDRRATDATKTAVRNAFEKLGLDETGKPKTNQPAHVENQTDMESILSKLLDAKLTPLQEKILGFEKEKTAQALSAKLKDQLKSKGVDEDWLIGRSLDVENEEGITAMVNKISTDWSTYVQKQAEKGVIISVPVSADGKPNEGQLGAKIAEKQNAGISGGIEGKKIQITN